MTTFSAPPHTTNHTPHQRRYRSHRRRVMAIKIRCSRPLCSSQTTTRTTHSTPRTQTRECFSMAGTRTSNPPPPTPKCQPMTRSPSQVQPPPPAHTQTTEQVYPAGVDRSCCPRTQQCANTPDHPNPVDLLPHAGATPPATPGTPIPDAVLQDHQPVRPGHYPLMFHP